MRETRSKLKIAADIERLNRLVEILREKQDRFRLALYKPHEKQQEFHRHPAQIRLITSGNRFGKSTAMIVEAIAYCLGERSWEKEEKYREIKSAPNRVLLVCQDFSNILEQTLLPKIFQFLPSDALLPGRQGVRIMHGNTPASFHFKNGSLLKLASFEQDVQKLEGADWDYIGIDEEIPRDHYIAARRGIIDRRGRIALAVTSVSPVSAWMYDELFIRADGKRIATFGGTSYDNPYIPADEIKEFEHSLTPEERISRIQGGFMQWAGRVYPEFDRATHVFDFDKWFSTPEQRAMFDSWPKGQVIDPHDRKPIAMGWFAINPRGDMIFFKEWPESDFFSYRTPHNLEGYVEIIRNIEKNIRGPMCWRIIDPNFGRSKKFGDEESVEDQFARFGLRYDSRVNDDIPAGHLAVKQYLYFDRAKPIDELFNRPKLYIEQGCTNMIRAFLQYTWQKRKTEDRKGLTERPEEKYKDFVDLARYAIMSSPKYIDRQQSRMQAQAERARIKTSWGR